MSHAVVKVPAAPVRKKAKHQSEMTNQLLFGETVKILKEKGDLWVKIQSLHDHYEGWMTNTLLEEIPESQAKQILEYTTGALFNEIRFDGNRMQLPFAASLRGFVGGKFSINNTRYEFEGLNYRRTGNLPSAEELKRLTSMWLNAPYMWGGRTVFGVDCSGFVQVIYKSFGIDLPRDAWQQAQEGAGVKKLKEAVCGDLAFFDDKEEIVHVGILLGDDKIIHASGKVRIDTIDKKGIINSETGKHSHFLRAIRRFG